MLAWQIVNNPQVPLSPQFADVALQKQASNVALDHFDNAMQTHVASGTALGPSRQHPARVWLAPTSSTAGWSRWVPGVRNEPNVIVFRD